MRDLQQQLSLAQTWCQGLGKQLTEQRQAVLSVLFAAKRSVKAYDILAELQKKHPTMAPVTVYRALDFLVDVGLVHKLESQQTFVVCEHVLSPQHKHEHQVLMLVCDQCQQVQEIESSQIFQSLMPTVNELGFIPARRDIELRGRCSACQ